MSRSRLPSDALARYIALGEGRSYERLAEQLGVSKAAVAARAKAENWKAAIKAIDAALREQTERVAIEGAEQARRHMIERQGKIQDVIEDVVSPDRLRAVLATLVKAAVKKEDVRAARLILDRVLGRPRNEPLAAAGLNLPSQLESTKDVRKASSALLHAVADGVLSPEDAMKAAAVVEAARRSIESEELEQRLAAVEEDLRRSKNQ